MAHRLRVRIWPRSSKQAKNKSSATPVTETPKASNELKDSTEALTSEANFTASPPAVQSLAPQSSGRSAIACDGATKDRSSGCRNSLHSSDDVVTNLTRIQDTVHKIQTDDKTTSLEVNGGNESKCDWGNSSSFVHNANCSLSAHYLGHTQQRSLPQLSPISECEADNSASKCSDRLASNSDTNSRTTSSSDESLQQPFVSGMEIVSEIAAVSCGSVSFVQTCTLEEEALKSRRKTFRADGIMRAFKSFDDDLFEYANRRIGSADCPPSEKVFEINGRKRCIASDNTVFIVPKRRCFSASDLYDSACSPHFSNKEDSAFHSPRSLSDPIYSYPNRTSLATHENKENIDDFLPTPKRRKSECDSLSMFRYGTFTDLRPSSSDNTEHRKMCLAKALRKSMVEVNSPESRTGANLHSYNTFQNLSSVSCKDTFSKSPLTDNVVQPLVNSEVYVSDNFALKNCDDANDAEAPAGEAVIKRIGSVVRRGAGSLSSLKDCHSAPKVSKSKLSLLGERYTSLLTRRKVFKASSPVINFSSQKPETSKSLQMLTDGCLVCVHESSCRDHISDCVKLKNAKQIVQKPGTPLSAATKSSSLGSHPLSSTSASMLPGAGVGLRHHGSAASAMRTRVGSGLSASPTRPYTLITSNTCAASPGRKLSSLSQWKRVATKLGVNTKSLNEEKDSDLLHEVPDNILDVNSASMESLEDGAEDGGSSWDEIDADPELRLMEEEPDLWVETVDRTVVESLSEKQVKKQEHIYELIITEKHHCRMLQVLQKVFVGGMSRELGMPSSNISLVFPRLGELLALHCSFLRRLRQRQRHNRHIEVIGDLLLDQFTGDIAHSYKEAYGLCCSQHNEAVAHFKELCKSDKRFNAFITQRYAHPLMKKKGIPECNLFISQRITKYPLIIEALLKYCRDQPEETALLVRALDSVREILVNIDSQVEEKEKKQLLLDVYNRIDAKSSTTYKDMKFKKSDLLNNSRKLMFECRATLTVQRGKPLPVHVVVMSDLVFFVHENNQKYYFVSPDNKAGAIPLEKLLIREKAGESIRSLYFIHEKNQAEMFEIECEKPADKKELLLSIRKALEQCPDEEDTSDGIISTAANAEKLRSWLAQLQQKDRDIAELCEEKELLLSNIVAELGSAELPASLPQYRNMLEQLDKQRLTPAQGWELQIKSLTEALLLVSGACAWSSGLARSVSSVGEHQSDAYVSPSLPKRAETFGGFDNSIKDGAPPNKVQSKKKKDPARLALTDTSQSTADAAADCEAVKTGATLGSNRRASSSLLTPRASQDNLSIMSSISSEISNSTIVGSVHELAQQQQQEMAVKLTRCLHTALVLSHYHYTLFEMLQRGASSSGPNGEARFRHSQKLEELRNIQEQIRQEKHNWTKERDDQEKWLQEKSASLRVQQDQLRSEQQDVQQQRELLYRKLEALRSQGIILSPTLTVMNTGLPHDDLTTGAGDTSGSSHSSPTGMIARPLKISRTTPPTAKRDSSSGLPTHLITAVNQPKSGVKQQLPMKLAKLGSGGSSSSSSSSMSSSLSSSMGGSVGGSTGGSMSPSQEHRCSPSGGTGKELQRDHSRGSLLSGSSFAGVTQILPLRLSESDGGNKTAQESRLARSSGGYQRLHSPPLPPAGADTLHHRTGSSPANLQNGGSASPLAPQTSPQGVAASAIAVGHVVSSSTGATAVNPSITRINPPPKPLGRPIASSPTLALGPGAAPAGVMLPPGSTRPGQRVKDPDTNEDIIFF